MSLLLLIFAGLPSPWSEVDAAACDIAKVAATERSYVRYLSAYAIPEANRADAAKVMRFWVNSISTRKRLAFPVRVENSSLYRLDLRDYGWSADAWEQLAKDDPYFKANWLSPGNEAILRAFTGTGHGVLRLDWFVSKTCLEPNYSRFLGLPGTLDELKKKFAVDDAAVEALSLEQFAGVLQSIVALHNRQLRRAPSLTGYFWSTFDTRTNAGRQAVIDNVFGVEFNAGEHIWALANGLQGYYLADAQGKQQAEVPNDLAEDSVTPFQRKAVVNARSCIGCHTEGIKPANDVIEKLLRQEKLQLRSYDKAQVIKLEELYLAGLAKSVTKDQQQYADAVKACNGLTTEANANFFTAFVYAYSERPVDAVRAAREIGQPNLDCLTPSYTGTLLALTAGQSIAVDAWESLYAEAAQLAYLQGAK